MVYLPEITDMSCPNRCHEIGGPWIAEDPDCPVHGRDAQSRAEALEWRIQSLERRIGVLERLEGILGD